MFNIYWGTKSVVTRDNKECIAGLGTKDTLSAIRSLKKDNEVIQLMIDTLLHLLHDERSSEISHKLGGDRYSDAVYGKDRLRKRHKLGRTASGREKLGGIIWRVIGDVARRPSSCMRNRLLTTLSSSPSCCNYLRWDC